MLCSPCEGSRGFRKAKDLNFNTVFIVAAHKRKEYHVASKGRKHFADGHDIGHVLKSAARREIPAEFWWQLTPSLSEVPK